MSEFHGKSRMPRPLKHWSEHATLGIKEPIPNGTDGISG